MEDSPTWVKKWKQKDTEDALVCYRVSKNYTYFPYIFLLCVRTQDLGNADCLSETSLLYNETRHWKNEVLIFSALPLSL